MNAHAAMDHAYFSDLPPSLHILPHSESGCLLTDTSDNVSFSVSSIFMVPGIKLMSESKSSTRNNWRV